ncbi:MAG: hypothetical protein WBA28_09025 [Microbacteriaceae bacterium]
MKNKVLATTAVIALGFTLSACSTSGFDRADCSVGGPTVDLVSANSDLTKTPNPSFPFPLKAVDTEVNVVVNGTGAPVIENQIIKTRISIYSGKDGSLVYDGNHSDMRTDPLFLLVNDATIGDSQFAETLDALKCSTVGSRFIVTTPAGQVFSQEEAVMMGLDENDALVFLYDVIGSMLPKADGAERLVSNNNVPSVSLAPDGTPGLTFRTAPVPSEQIVIVLKQGNHEKLESGDAIAVHQTTWSWKNRAVTDSSWTGKTPSAFSLGSNEKELIPDEVLLQYPVGSQLMIVTPNADGSDASIVVVDILGIL